MLNVLETILRNWFVTLQKLSMDEFRIREIPDHATFREKEHTLGWLDKLGGFLSLALCNLGNFDQL